MSATARSVSHDVRSGLKAQNGQTFNPSGYAFHIGSVVCRFGEELFAFVQAFLPLFETQTLQTRSTRIEHGPGR
jgi:hypothetical protein